MEVAIEWYGHSYVLVETSGGTRIAIDPHDGGSLNLPEFRVEADAVLVTHNHYDHNAVEMVRGAREVVESFRGERRIGDVTVRGFKTFHDKVRGRLRGENTVYLLETAAGVRIAHMGDIGHKPDERLAAALRGVHVLILPVGGVYTIDAYEAWEIVEDIGPRVILPVHYWVPLSTVPLDPLGRFLDIAKSGRTRIETNRLELSMKGLETIKRTVVVMPDPYSFARK